MPIKSTKEYLHTSQHLPHIFNWVDNGIWNAIRINMLHHMIKMITQNNFILRGQVVPKYAGKITLQQNRVTSPLTVSRVVIIPLVCQLSVSFLSFFVFTHCKKLRI